MRLLLSVKLCSMCWVYACAHLEHYAKFVQSSLVSPGALGSHHDINSLIGPTALLALPPSICSSFHTFLWLYPPFFWSLCVAYSVTRLSVPLDKFWSQPGCNLQEKSFKVYYSLKVLNKGEIFANYTFCCGYFTISFSGIGRLLMQISFNKRYDFFFSIFNFFQ